MQLLHLLAALPALAVAVPAAVEEAQPMITARDIDSSALASAIASGLEDVGSLAGDIGAFTSNLGRYSGCATVTDARDAAYCINTAGGWNTAAASYLADQGTNTDVVLAEVALYTDDAFAAQVTSITDGPALASAEIAQASKLATEFNRAALVSVEQQALSLQTAKSKAAAAPAQTGFHLAAGVAAGVAGLAIAL